MPADTCLTTGSAVSNHLSASPDLRKLSPSFSLQSMTLVGYAMVSFGECSIDHWMASVISMSRSFFVCRGGVPNPFE